MTRIGRLGQLSCAYDTAVPPISMATATARPSPALVRLIFPPAVRSGLSYQFLRAGDRQTDVASRICARSARRLVNLRFMPIKAYLRQKGGEAAWISNCPAGRSSGAKN